MKKPKGLRPLKSMERQTPWLLLAITGAVFLLLAEITAILAVHEVAGLSWGYTLRGYTPLGLALGVIAALLSVTTFMYSLRKRALQESMPLLRGTMMMWLWAHVYFGILAVLAVVFHAGPGLVSWQLTSGKLVLAIFLLLTFSGIAWRLIYKFIPPKAASEVGNYSESDSQDKAAKLWVEIEKIAAGKSAEFAAFKTALEEGQLDSRKGLAKLSAAESRAFAELEALFKRRQKYLGRQQRQLAYDRFLQGWRLLHIPMAVLFMLLLTVHIVDALQIPQRVLPQHFNGYPPATECAACHSDIYIQWAESMHAHAVSSPVTQVQTNQVARFTLNNQDSPDPALLCNNCHSPAGAQISGSATLPFEISNPKANQVANEGVSCSTCHQFAGQPVSGGGGLASVFQQDLVPGRTFFGALGNIAVGNAYHQSASAGYAKDPSSLCQSCHNVNYDLNGDGRIVKGVDLVLQTTYDEYLQYRADGGRETCISCHMPLTNSTRAAEDAQLLFQQDIAAPPRQVHDHSFVGVDYPLDKVGQSDPQRQARQALLRESAAFAIDPASIQLENGTLRFNIDITNVGVGHNLPTGFAFARQMWFEVRVEDQRGNAIYESGVLRGGTDDLCDSATMDDSGNPVMPFFIGCTESDPQLVNFQLKLVNDIDILRNESGQPVTNDQGEFILIQATGAEETWLQALTAGAVVRVRPGDGQAMGPIAPQQTRSFQYQVDLPQSASGQQLRIEARLLFRNLPPYFLRALAADQPAAEEPQLSGIISNLQVVEMNSDHLLVVIP